jgi:diadenosine tetraphosphate (Ap4A) HIT family hydrolase
MTEAPAHPHATLVKFGFPRTLLHQGEHWSLLVRPAQPTLGSLVLCASRDIRAYGDLPPAAFAEQGQLVARLERLLQDFVAFEKINYLMLMMVDPQVHIHVLPRYEGERTWDGTSFRDSGWPGLPDLASHQPASDALIKQLRERWTMTASQTAGNR